MPDNTKQLQAEEKMGDSTHQEGKPDCYVLDMESLSLLTTESDSTPDHVQLKFQKTLPRKFSQRNERKSSATDSKGIAVSAPGPDLPVIVVQSSSPIGSAGTPQQSTPGTGTQPCRRRRGPSPPPWLDPRRVLIFFATLSSMGTIILIYFTLSMSKMDGDDANAR